MTSKTLNLVLRISPISSCSNTDTKTFTGRPRKTSALWDTPDKGSADVSA